MIAHSMKSTYITRDDNSCCMLIFLFFFKSFVLVRVIGQKSGCDSILSWQCKNGECIGIAERCNGISDCTDGSDETVRECISFQCNESKFRCTYGACVNKTSECNGAQDCADNSGASQMVLLI